MKVAFRVDSSTQMGIGHLMRCLALADELSKSGASVEFISRQLEGNIIAEIEARNYRVHSLPAPNRKLTSIQSSGLRHQAWLGCTQADDATQCAGILQNIKPDWLIVDHYAIDIEWEGALSPYRKYLMVIDDLADRKHDCHVLLDQNWFSSTTKHRYELLVPDYCTKLLGPEFALLKPEFCMLRRLMPDRDGYIRRVLISMGGSDPTNETLKVLTALMHPELRQIVAEIVCGANYDEIHRIESLAVQRGNTKVHRALPTLAGLMMRADLMIGAGGTTTWERMCLGLPAIVISVAENQYQPNLNLAQDGYILFAGDKAQVTVSDLQQIIISLMQNRCHYLQLSQASYSLVSGLGAIQVVNTLKNISSYGTC